MAKPFYSLEEVCELLGKDADGVKALVRDGKLREFRDAGKIFFKAEDVNKLAGPSAAGGDEIDLEPADDELPSLADPGGGTSVLGLAPLDDDEEKKEKEGTVISASGIGVFDDDELEIDADPMAKTQITEAATTDQVALEGTGSGSGLLDLTREADDTSLGAELLDDIYPGEEESAPAAPPPPRTRAPEPPVEEEPVPVEEPVVVSAPVVVGDTSEGLFGGMLVAAILLLVTAGSVVAGTFQNFVPDYAKYLAGNFLILLGGAVGVLILSILFGWLIGRAGAPVRR